MLTYYSGMLIVKVADKTQCNRSEDFALKLYGKRCKTFTSLLNLTCLMGFITTYIVYVKSMIPKLLLLFWVEKELPSYVVGDFGRFFWGTMFSVCLLLPMSIPRTINALRFTSLFGVICSIYLMLTVFFVFYCNKEMVPDPSSNFKNANLFSVSISYLSLTLSSLSSALKALSRLSL